MNNPGFNPKTNPTMIKRPCPARFWLFAVGLMLTAYYCDSAHAADAPITILIQGKARDSNPTIVVDIAGGDSDLAELVRTTLLHSDWFRPVSADGDYALEVRAQSGGGLSLKLRSRDGAEISVVSPPSVGGQTQEVYRAVDNLIKSVFDSPGLCRARLAFVKNIDGVKEIYTADFNGDNPKILTRNHTLSVEPHWGGNRRYLVYTLYSAIATDIMLIDLGMDRQRRLTRSPGLNSGAALSNSGRQVAMTLSGGQNVDLYIMDLPNGKPQKLTSSSGLEASPCWSPNDKKLCYVSDQQGRPRLYLLSSRGGKPKRLLPQPMECVSPSWSTVSNKICFAMRQDNRYVIGVVNMRDRDRTIDTIVTAPGDWEAPSWAPDGRHIICSRNFEGKKSLYFVDSLFHTIVPLKNFTGDDTLPVFSPLP